MPNNNTLVNSGYPALPFYVNDHGLDSLFNITLISGSAALEAGTVLGKITASGKYDAYNDGHSDGTQTAKGILMYRTDPTAGDTLTSLMVHGVVRSGSLTGIDANGIADLPLILF